MLKKLQHINWNKVMYFTLFLIGVIAVVIIMALVKEKDDAQSCKDVKIVIEGTEAFIDQSDINKIIVNNYGHLVGKPMRDLPLQKIETTLRKLPYISAVSVHAEMNGVVNVDIVQREVALRIINKNGNEYYVAPNGLKVPTTLKYVPHVLVANGNIDEGYGKGVDSVKSKVVSDLLLITEYINKSELWKNQVVQLYVNSNKDIELIPRVGEQELILGSADSLETKFELLKDFYLHIMPKVGADAYSKVNVKYAGQIICEKKGSWSFDNDSLKTNQKKTL